MDLQACRHLSSFPFYTLSVEKDRRYCVPRPPNPFLLFNYPFEFLDRVRFTPCRGSAIVICACDIEGFHALA